MEEWLGDTPYYLMSVGRSAEDDALDIVDLDRPGWLSTQGHLLRREGSELYLVQKEPQKIIFSLAIFPGDRAYYLARHIGFTGGSSAETIAYSIGKKRADGNEDNLWYLPWGQVCVGKDVEYFAINGLKSGLQEQIQPRGASLLEGGSSE